MLQGVREAYLLALRGVLVSSGPRLAPATLTKVGAALDSLRGSQGAHAAGTGQQCRWAGSPQILEICATPAV